MRKAIAATAAWQTLPSTWFVGRHQLWSRIALSILAFAIYAGGVLSLRQDLHSAWVIEAEYSLPSAVSYAVLGRPLGFIDANVQAVFKQTQRPENRISIQSAMAQAAAGSLSPGQLLQLASDGNGAGYPIVASLAIWLFGVHLSSLPYFFLVFIGLSTLAFSIRFTDKRLLIAPLLFLPLTLMLLSPLASNPAIIDQVPIGGVRYFAIAGLLPALHLLLELADRSREAERRAAAGRLVLLVLQAALLAFVVLVRGSAGYLLAPIALVALYTGFRGRHDAAGLRQLLGKSALALIAGGTLISLVAKSVPEYVETGRFFGNVWHRMFIGLGLHPAWPFGDLRERYKCADAIPEGLVAGTPDGNAHCVFWSSYPPAATSQIADEEVRAHLLDGVYEGVLRSAFFEVVRSYPRQVIAVYVRDKSLSLLRMLGRALAFDVPGVHAAALWLALLQCAVFISCLAMCRGGSREIASIVWPIPVLFIFSLLPAYVAWPSLSVSADTILLLYATSAVAMSLAARIMMERAPESAKDLLSLPAVRWHKVPVAGVLIVTFGLTLASYQYVAASRPTTTDSALSGNVALALSAANDGANIVAKGATVVAELPALPDLPSAPNRWDLVEGLRAHVLDERVVAAGQPALRLVAIGSDCRHALGAQFRDVGPNGRHRAQAWVKVGAGGRVMLEVRDGIDEATGKPSTYGIVRFNLAARSVVDSVGDILDSGVEPAADGWVKLWADLSSRDGQIFAVIGLLEGRNNNHVFTSRGQEITFGGFAISPRQPAFSTSATRPPTATVPQ